MLAEVTRKNAQSCIAATISFEISLPTNAPVHGTIRDDDTRRRKSFDTVRQGQPKRPCAACRCSAVACVHGHFHADHTVITLDFDMRRSSRSFRRLRPVNVHPVALNRGFGATYLS